MSEAWAMWRRLDAPGHDVCWLEPLSDGWQLTGTAVFVQDSTPVALDYTVAADKEWVSRRGQVRGVAGDDSVDLTMERTLRDGWTLNGHVMPALDDCVDLDLGFTPATNLLVLRRLKLDVGEASGVTSAWLDFVAGTLEPLTQRYERRAEDAFWYEAPRFDYRALLVVAPSGFVQDYPGLWEMES